MSSTPAWNGGNGIAINYSYEDVPTLADFALSNAFIRGVIGPFGSGKSSAMVAEIVRRGLAQRPGPDGVRRTRWAVIRNTYSELRDTTMNTVEQWLPEKYFGRLYRTDHRYLITAFPGAEIEIIFRALDKPDDVKHLLSLELTGAWVNEAREVPWSVIEAIQGRVGRYPAMRDGGPTWSGVFMDTNPPDGDSKWFRFFEDRAWIADWDRIKQKLGFPADAPPENFAAIFKQPSGRSSTAENLSNLKPGYYELLSVGKSAEWNKIYVDGDYGFVVEGKLVYPEFNDSAHVRAVDPMPGLTVIRSWDFGLCYSDDTEVLTDHGWKLFKDVDEKVDRAASRDPVTGRMEWAPIAFKIAKPFKGDLLQWASTELNMLVTPEHRVPYTHRDHSGDVRWASAQWLADNVGRHHMVDLTSKWEAEGGKFVEIGGRSLPSRDYAEFMGLYLSEGSGDGRRISIYQRDQKPEMQRILDATGIRWRWLGDGKAAGWHGYDRAFAPHLKAYGTAKYKRVPQVIKDMDAESIRAFIWAYTLGDGHVRTRENGAVEHTVFTTSKDMADDFQELAQKVGWNSSVRRVKPQTSVFEGRSITNTGGYNVTFKKRARRAELHRRNFSRVPYDGTVYCLNVPHHTLYVRRNGKPHWNGNTPACIFSQLLPTGQWLTFDEMTSDNMSVDEFGDEVLEHCTRAFRGQVQFEDLGDPAGNNRHETDKRSAFDILQAKGIPIRAAASQDPTARQESVRKPLRTMRGGEPQFILHPRCKVLRKGFMGGYHRRRLKVSGPERYSAEPDKNEYSHPHDALQYGMVEYFWDGITTSSQQTEDDFFANRDYGVDATRSPVTGY